MPYFNSTAIHHAEYDDATATLRVTFPNGGAYDYFGVPRYLYEGLCSAESVGTYFNDHIRDQYGRG